MTDIGIIIKEAREKRLMSIEELSKLSKIRPYILIAIENGDLTVQSDVYMKAFVKTISGILKIESEEITNFLYPPQTGKVKKHPDLSNAQNSAETQAQHFTKLFKKNVAKKSRKKEYILYSILGAFALILVFALYLLFFNNNLKTPSMSKSDSSSTNDVLMVQKSDKKNLLSYFQNNDSLTLKAKAIDTVWLRIDIDGKSSEEVMMKPGMELQWSAVDHFTIDQGNVGGIIFYRNDNELPLFGAKGTVVKNIKITRTEVQNDNPWKTDSLRKAAVKQHIVKKKKDEKPERPMMIEQSGIEKINPLKK